MLLSSPNMLAHDRPGRPAHLNRLAYKAFFFPLHRLYVGMWRMHVTKRGVRQSHSFASPSTAVAIAPARPDPELGELSWPGFTLLLMVSPPLLLLLINVVHPFLRNQWGWYVSARRKLLMQSWPPALSEPPPRELPYGTRRCGLQHPRVCSVARTH